MVKVIMHVDLNCFFARCEQLKDKSLLNKPIMIGGVGRRGIVSTCSYEARKYGVHSGMPSFKAFELCPNIIALPGDYEFYSLMSKEFFAFARSITSKVEEASIDECYLDITDVIKNKNVHYFLKKFQSDLFKKTGLMCSIGVGPTRFLAKMGSDYKKPMGITIIRKKDIKEKLYPLRIESFYGIGNKSAPRLRSIGIKYIGDLANYLINNKEGAINTFGSYYYELLNCLNGNSDDNVYLEFDDPKSIGNSMTLMMDTDDEEEIAKAIKMLSQEVSERAKAIRQKGKTIQLVLKDTDFAVHNKSLTIDEATNDADEIYKIAASLYNKYFLEESFRLVGVTLSNLVPLHERNQQLSLFDEPPEDKINDVINEVNRKFKRKVVDKASIMLSENKYGNK